jgi:hypothetical protein
MKHKCAVCPDPIQAHQRQVQVGDDHFHNDCFWERMRTISERERNVIQAIAQFEHGRCPDTLPLPFET